MAPFQSGRVICICKIVLDLYKLICVCIAIQFTPLSWRSMELQDALNENESLKASISKLREEINEKRKELQVEKELRISAVQDARADERANAKLELQELRQKLTSEKSKEIAGVREELRLKTKMELDTLQEIKEREVSSFQKKLAEAEKGQRSAEQEVEKIRKAQASKSDTDLKKLHRSLFEIQEARDELKTKFDAISAADKEKAELIRQLKENHEKEMKKQSQESRQASKKQVCDVLQCFSLPSLCVCCVFVCVCHCLCVCVGGVLWCVRGCVLCV